MTSSHLLSFSVLHFNEFREETRKNDNELYKNLTNECPIFSSVRYVKRLGTNKFLLMDYFLALA